MKLWNQKLMITYLSTMPRIRSDTERASLAAFGSVIFRWNCNIVRKYLHRVIIHREYDIKQKPPKGLCFKLRLYMHTWWNVDFRGTLKSKMQERRREQVIKTITITLNLWGYQSFKLQYYIDTLYSFKKNNINWSQLHWKPTKKNPTHIRRNTRALAASCTTASISDLLTK